MRIIRNRRVSESRWRAVPEGALDSGLPPDLPDAVILTLADWKRHGRALASRRALGVRLAPGDDIDAIIDDLGSIELVALEFGSFTEGRPYSVARRLRERLGFEGEIRAVGDVSRDRLAFMERCGFDAFELRADCDPSDALGAFDEIADVYQRAADSRAVIASRRG